MTRMLCNADKRGFLMVRPSHAVIVSNEAISNSILYLLSS
jgi:hypothetical protein